MEVAIANGEDKIMTSTSSNQDTQVSVSFGKFENDLLSWEKFSSFSPNKYLEEVEKCATPGSVSQKKAYFESHYKKITERKAEIILEQEKQSETIASFRASLENRGNTDSESACYVSNGESTSGEDKLVTSIATEVNETCNYEPLEETVNLGECQSSVDAGEDEYGEPNQVNKKAAATKIVTSRRTQPSKEKSMIKATNKAESPVSKASTPRVSKPASAINSMSTSRSSVKKENVSTLPRKKQTAQKILDTSLSLDQPGSEVTALATTRRSLFTEQMGDKDIVRRAFKTFQKSFDQMKPSLDVQDPAPKQVPGKATSVSKLATTGERQNGRLARSDVTEKKGSNSHGSSSFEPKIKGTTEKHEQNPCKDLSQKAIQTNDDEMWQSSIQEPCSVTDEYCFL
ncbi:unnamed protein product [Thlaspi arvense]|uniref:Protein WVD2-like 7 n=1 Tax=Thlaspi arvense TaxID=13288 RepID=A0AAU9SF37_THLAR|nr:unnamed protein product [Thlaspi arvense]